MVFTREHQIAIDELSDKCNWSLAFLKTKFKSQYVPENHVLECLHYLIEEIDRRAINEKRRYIERSKG
jgi:hypothetical protein